ncbi:MAG: four helix bundle protein [Syntrophobacterales bacterium]|jgi:four helix bundle protein|nr:four helix bundle protein [Syntrophobacterales bacterium]
MGAYYKDLIVWQKAMELTQEIYRLAKQLPQEELFSLSDQMRRAAVSIPSNIAEGQNRNSSKEFLNFLSIARGSRAELETQLQICVKVGYLADKDILEAAQLLSEIGKMLGSLITKVRTTC